MKKLQAPSHIRFHRFGTAAEPGATTTAAPSSTVLGASVVVSELESPAEVVNAIVVSGEGARVVAEAAVRAQEAAKIEIKRIFRILRKIEAQQNLTRIH